MGRMVDSWYFKLLSLLLPVYFAFVRFLCWIKRKVTKSNLVPKVTDDILLQSAVTVAHKIRSRQLTSSEVVSAYIGRIREINPILNCVVLENLSEARKTALQIDAQITAGNAPDLEEKPLLGVPFSLKDCIFVKGLVCTAGIPCRQEEKSLKDAEVVNLLRTAGAIPLAVTNVSEVCMWWEANNGIFGRTLNAYDTRCIVGGSSGGEGCLISAGGSVIGLGSDIGGSIRMPAYFNGVFGHKPTSGIISHEGCYPPVKGNHAYMHSAGPMCRYADDLLPMLTIIAGPKFKLLKPFKAVDFSAIKFYPMPGISSIFVSPVDSQVLNAIIKVTKFFKTRYDSVIEETDLSLMHWALPMWLNDMQEEGSPAFSQEMVNREGDINPSMELCKLVFGQSPHTLPALLLAVFEKLTINFGSKEKRAKVVEMREELSSQVQELLGDDGVILFPPHPTQVPVHNQPILTPYNYIYTGIFNCLGLPATQVPMGLGPEGTPLGVQVVANLNNDMLSIAVAKELEKAFGGWVNPGTAIG